MITMARKTKKSPGRRNGTAVAMIKRYPRKQVFRHKNDRRAKDDKNSWKRDWE